MVEFLRNTNFNSMIRGVKASSTRASKLGMNKEAPQTLQDFDPVFRKRDFQFVKRSVHKELQVRQNALTKKDVA